jgi:SAM-dependent methyltransferase
VKKSHRSSEAAILEKEDKLRAWFTQECDPARKVVDGLDIGWGGVQRWATGRISIPATSQHLDIACGYATFLAQLGWRFPEATLIGLNIDFNGPHGLARSLLSEAGVKATLVQADARRMPFATGTFASTSCFLGLQDIRIGFGQPGVQATVAEAVRVTRSGGVLVLLEEFSFEEFENFLSGLPVTVIDRAERSLEVQWNREVAERAIALYAEGWAAQVRSPDEAEKDATRLESYRRMKQEMEGQLRSHGYYVPFGPVRLVVAQKIAEKAT